MNKIFSFVRDILLGLANISHLSYNAVNIVVYYIVIPFIYFIIIDRILGAYYFTISYFIIIAISIFLIKDFELFSDWLFTKSANFLHSFSVIGMNYIVASVIICVFIPLAFLILLLLILAWFKIIVRHQVYCNPHNRMLCLPSYFSQKG